MLEGLLSMVILEADLSTPNYSPLYGGGRGVPRARNLFSLTLSFASLSPCWPSATWASRPSSRDTCARLLEPSRTFQNVLEHSGGVSTHQMRQREAGLRPPAFSRSFSNFLELSRGRREKFAGGGGARPLRAHSSFQASCCAYIVHMYKGASLIRKFILGEPYRGPMPWFLGGPRGGAFSDGRGIPVKAWRKVSGAEV